MTVADRFLAIDWGTTNRRVYLIEDGQCLRTERDHRGVRATPQGSYEAELAGIRQRFGDLPVVMAGMVGSSIGWQAAPYVEAPANFARLTAAILRMDERTVIVPGVCQKQPADVMRGEEVQVLGAVAAIQLIFSAFAGGPNARLSRFGRSLGRYLAQLASFETFASEELPFPFADWPAGD